KFSSRKLNNNPVLSSSQPVSSSAVSVTTAIILELKSCGCPHSRGGSRKSSCENPCRNPCGSSCRDSCESSYKGPCENSCESSRGLGAIGRRVVLGLGMLIGITW
ncbi:hypothetical protein C1645_833482, partial [Glomus cerebriforme]